MRKGIFFKMKKTAAFLLAVGMFIGMGGKTAAAMPRGNDSDLQAEDLKNGVIVKDEEETAPTEEITGSIQVKTNVIYSEMQEYIDGFMKKYPGITVYYECVTDYEETMKTRFENGNYGDVLFIPSYFTSRDCAQYLTSLGNYIGLSKKYNFMATSIFANQTVYGVPSSAYLMGVIYNKEVFDRAGITELPRTIEEFIQALELIRERTDAVPFYTNYTSNWALQCWEQFAYIEMTGNADYKENIFPFEKDPFLKGSSHYEVYDLLYYIVNQGLCEEDPLSSSWDESKKMLNEGTAGCMICGSWAIDQVKDAGNNGQNIGFMPFPNQINGIQYATVFTDYCYGISRNCENKEAAKLFVEYMLDESGYALDHDTISIVRTDPIPDVYGNMENVAAMVNNVSNGSNYDKKARLAADLDFEGDKEIERVIQSALGITMESFDDITADWNERWEANRTEDIPAKVSNTDWRDVYNNGAAAQENETDSINSVISREYHISFSDTEKDYLLLNPVVKIGYIRNMPPYQYEKEGAFAGVAADFLQIVSDNTGLVMEYVGYDNVEQLISALDSGEIAAAAGITDTDGYAGRVKFSREYIECMNAVVKSDTMDIDQMLEKRPVLVEGEDYSFITLPATDKYCSTVAESIRLVEKLEADYTISNYYTANYYIKLENYKHVAVVPINGSSSLCVAFDKDVDTRLVSIINKCIYTIPENEIQVMLMSHMDTPAAQITLKRFIEDNVLLSLLVVAGIFVIIAGAVSMLFWERYRSARKHAIDAKRYSILTALSDEYVFEYDYKRHMLHLDKKFEGKFLFYGDIALDSYDYSNEDLNEIIRDFNDPAKEGELPVKSLEITMADQSKCWYKLVAYLINDSKGRHEHIIGKLVYAQAEMEEKQYIQNKAVTDPLTGLYNREGFREYFDKQYERIGKGGKDILPLTFAIMDIDDFKAFNDTLGHAGGDEALKFLAERLKEEFSENAVAARYGGDEFILCVYGGTNSGVRHRLEAFVRSMERSFDYREMSVDMSISLGAVFTEKACPYETLFKTADRVLYQVKGRGKNGYQLTEIGNDPAEI